MTRRTTDQNHREMRQRVDALLRVVKPSTQMVKGSIAPLIKKLQKEAALRHARNAEFMRFLRSLERLQPRGSKVSAKEVKAARAFRDSLIRKAKALKVKPPTVTAVPPQIRSGSIFTVSIPPYSDRWNFGS